MSTNPNQLLAETCARVAQGIISQADFAAGYKDVVVTDKAGTDHTVRVAIVMRGLRSEILRRYAVTSDPRVIIRPFVPKEFGRTAFLDSLFPPSVCKLANVAASLLIGPETAQRALHSKPIL